MSVLRRLLEPSHPPRTALALLAAAAVAVAVGGLEHARLFHRGYAEVEVVGPLFLLDAIGSAVTILLLIARRSALFVVGSLTISAGSLVSILFSHGSSFFGFSEGGYDGAATVIVVAEGAAILLTGLALMAGAVDHRGGDGVSPVRGVLAALVVVAFALAVAGAGMGSAPAGGPAPAAAQVTAAKRAIAADPTAAEGAEEFGSEGCDACHALAATGAEGRLGPRLDTYSAPVRKTAGDITDPRAHIADGYEPRLMPTDYAARMSAAEIKAVATFIHTASTAGGGPGR